MNEPAPDVDEVRAESRERWERSAAGWTQTRESFQRTAQPVSDWMVAAIDPQPGWRVLELAAGLGDTGLMAAARVAPGGEVIITDGAEAMVAAAREHAQASGAEGVTLRTMEAEWIDLPTASVDAVLCRFGYMLLADPETALRETRRVLRPGGRVALAVWAAQAENPWLGIARDVLAAANVGPSPVPGSPGPFAMDTPDAVIEVLAATGFAESAVEALDIAFEAPSLDGWWDYLQASSTNTREAVARLAPAEHYALRDALDAAYAPYVATDGSVRLPARALVAAATA